MTNDELRGALRAEVRGSRYKVGKRWFRAVGAIVGARHASPAVCGAHVLQILRLFIPKHHCRLSRARRDTHISIIGGRGTPRPYKALRRQGYRRDLLLLQGASLKLEVVSLKYSYFVLRTSYFVHSTYSKSCRMVAMPAEAVESPAKYHFVRRWFSLSSCVCASSCATR